MTGRHTDNTMKDIDAQNILEAYEAVDSETGERMSPDKHAKAVQWTKDIKAKLAKAQEIGDSKEANKLQRYLDMHGIDEAGGIAQSDPSSLDRVASLAIDKLGDITDYSSSSDYSISDLIDVSIEDVESEMGERQHDLNEPNANDKIKDLIIRNLSSGRRPSKGLGSDRAEDKWHRGRGGYIPGQHD